VVLRLVKDFSTSFSPGKAKHCIFPNGHQSGGALLLRGTIKHFIPLFKHACNVHKHWAGVIPCRRASQQDVQVVDNHSNTGYYCRRKRIDRILMRTDGLSQGLEPARRIYSTFQRSEERGCMGQSTFQLCHSTTTLYLYEKGAHACSMISLERCLVYNTITIRYKELLSFIPSPSFPSLLRARL